MDNTPKHNYYDPVGDCTGYKLFLYLMEFLKQKPNEINLTNAGYFEIVINSILYL